MPEAKPYDIPKQLVWDAYQRVKANRGAAGVDGESLAAFEQDLKGNLYKVWNRMSSSGSYFPPPVRLVEIEKDNGGTRPLGIPTVADRVCQTVAKMVLEPPRALSSRAESSGPRQSTHRGHAGDRQGGRRAVPPTAWRATQLLRAGGVIVGLAENWNITGISRVPSGHDRHGRHGCQAGSRSPYEGRL